MWWVSNYHRCVRWNKKFFWFSLKDHDHEWPSFIYIRGNQMCDGSPTITDVWDGRKNFWCSWKDHEHEWPSFIYIRGNQMCDGSPTIIDVWDGRKNFLILHDHEPWVTIYYIYKMKPNVWWVTNYHRCVRWKKNFFWFSMTNTNVCCVSLVCVSWHKNIFCKESPPVMVMWRFWFAR
jgi:hypothetical protein